MPSYRGSLIAILACALIMPAGARAQNTIGFESLLKDINDINFFFSCWQPSGEVERRGDCPVGKNGYGVEVSYEIGRWGLWKSPRVEVKAYWDSAGLTWKPGSPIARSDSTIVGTRHKAEMKPAHFMLVEFALGYSQFSGFGSSSSTFELTGTTREIPSVAVYGTLQKLNSKGDVTGYFGPLSPYFGIRSGLIQLNNAQIATRATGDTLVMYKGSSTAFQIGGTAGLVVGLFKDRLSIFGERAYNVRKFSSVEWAATGTPKILDRFPRTLDFSGPTTTFGIQVTLRDPR